MLPKVGLSSGISSPPPTDSRPSPQPLHLGTPGPLDGVGGGHRDLLNFRGLLCDSISQLPSDPRGPWGLSTAAPHVLLSNLRACGFQMPTGPEGQRPSREPPAQPQGLGCCGDGWQEGWGQKWGFVQGLHSLAEPPPTPGPTHRMAPSVLLTPRKQGHFSDGIRKHLEAPARCGGLLGTAAALASQLPFPVPVKASMCVPWGASPLLCSAHGGLTVTAPSPGLVRVCGMPCGSSWPRGPASQCKAPGRGLSC